MKKEADVIMNDTAFLYRMSVLEVTERLFSSQFHSNCIEFVLEMTMYFVTLIDRCDKLSRSVFCHWKSALVVNRGPAINQSVTLWWHKLKLVGQNQTRSPPYGWARQNATPLKFDSQSRRWQHFQLFIEPL